MSKELARGSASYENERLAITVAPTILRAKGFQAVRAFRSGGMKIAETTRVDGTAVVFWIKQAWSTTPKYSALQFGMLPPDPPPKSLPDNAFIDYVAERVHAAKKRRATHALLVHLFNEKIQNYVALEIDAVVPAYARQIDMLPHRARNTKTPTLYFGDERMGADRAFLRIVTDFEIRLEDLSGLSSEVDGDRAQQGVKKVTAEIERRFQQEAFRNRVGERYRWRCAISGVTITEMLDAAHLPGRNWRFHNEASDGVLIRADLHRLLDYNLATIANGLFLIKKRARLEEYAAYHRRPIAP